MRTTISAALFLTVMMAVCLVGCSKSGDGQGEGPAPHKPMAAADLRAMFQRTTDTELPADVTCIDGLSVKSHCELGDIITESVFMKFEAPDSFKELLKGKLKSTSNEPEWVMTSDPPPALPGWDLKDMEGMKVYVGKTARQDDGRYFKISAAFDEKRPVVYVASGEVVPPAPPKPKAP